MLRNHAARKSGPGRVRFLDSGIAKSVETEEDGLTTRLIRRRMWKCNPAQVEMSMYKLLSVDGYASPQASFSPGPAPMLIWIDVKLLVVDPSYQREIGRRGMANIRAIAESFDWSKFAPVIVAPIEGGLFAIVDGQHRTTAAMLRGIEKVPCQSVQADRAQQAAAFAAVNGQVTKTTAHQVFYAKLAARDAEALELARVCDAASVTIPRKNMVLSKMKKGQTQAVGALQAGLRAFGSETLITALQCITETGDGNPGWLRARMIEALCRTLHENPVWRDAGDTLLRAMDTFDFATAWDEASEAAGKSVQPFEMLLRQSVKRHLAARLRANVTEVPGAAQLAA